MEIDAEILSAEQIDYERLAELQRHAYAELLTKLRNSDSFMNADFYRWKFHPPAGPARIAVFRRGDEILSTNSLIPVNIAFEGAILKGWQACDAATHPNARGKRYSPRCAKALMDSIDKNEIFYVYPNSASISATTAIGVRVKETITTWVKPCLSGSNKLATEVSQVDSFDKGINALAKRLASNGDTMIYRTEDYLNWRYVQHPVHKYNIFVYSRGEEKCGFAIVRIVQTMGREMAMLMELWGDDFLIHRALLRRITVWMNENSQKYLIFQDNRMAFVRGIISGFIPVPSFMLPKKQVLMLYAKPDPFLKQIIGSRWHTQWGDWDGF